ncbi:hypothetical protein T484DRAFT_1812441 [Baffinella frigidus]|nr:hypothetical protein T484DRAFT_1812441 [Cryptophyta sp. CCMP2293]
MSISRQEATRRAFQMTAAEGGDRACNLMVATSVAEEGLDFPACSLVVRYSSVETLVSLIQSRGRARRQGANLAVFTQNYEAVKTQEKNAIHVIDSWAD